MEPINKNTFHEWIECKNRVQNRLTENQYKQGEIIEFQVIIKEDNIENLIYFFPIADMARMFRFKTKLVITVKGKNIDQLTSKIKQFLFLQQLFRESLSIVVNGKDTTSQTRYGRLQPIIAVTNSESQFQYKKIGVKKINDEDICFLLDLMITTSIRKNNLTTDELERLLKITNNHPELYTKNFIYDNQDKMDTLHSKDMRWGSLFFIGPDDDMNIVYSKMIYSNLASIIDILKKNKNGSGVAKEIISYFMKETDTLPLITKYVCSLIIRYLVESEVLQNNIANLDDEDIDEDNYNELGDEIDEDLKFYKSLFDISLNHAEAVSDGLRQIIENACLYSQSKSAYFYLRIHRTEIEASSNTKTRFEIVQNNVNTLLSLHEEYKGYKLKSENKFYLEICFVDNAFGRNGTKGMKEHFEATRSNVTVNGLKDIFRYEPHSKSDLLIHYGLRIFERTVRMNHGAFIVRTPSGEEGIKGYTYRSLVNQIDKNTKDYKTEISKNTRDREYYSGTIYKAIIPISDNLGQDTAIVTQEPIELFETRYIREKFIPYLINIELTEEDKQSHPKNSLVNLLCIQLKELLKPISNQINRIICIRPVGFTVIDMELIAKAIVNYQLEDKDSTYRIALILNEKNQIIEFTRMYAAFCDISGENYQRFRLKDSQIAMCKLDDSSQIPCVCYVLCGNDLVSAQRSVRNYLYFNSETTMEFLPVIRYLTGFYDERKTTNKKPIETDATPIFPFDLYLDIDNSEEYHNDRINPIEEKIWFFQYINHNLLSDMQTTPNGCCLSNVHVSIGSKIHVNKYYNADFLFNNYANVYRFAYLVARDILDDYLSLEKQSGLLIERKNIVMVAYGEYSLILIQKICNILKKECSTIEQVDYILFPSYIREEEQREWLAQGSEIRQFLHRHHIRDNDLEKYIFYPVIPLSTTLSTVQRIQDFIIRICKSENLKTPPVFGLNSSLVVVGKKDENKKISEFYWDEFDEDKKTIQIKSINPVVESWHDRRVKYIFNPEGKWYKASQTEIDALDSSRCGCEICNQDDKSNGNRKSLIGVDKTSTLPNVIFDSLNHKKKLFDLECITTTYPPKSTKQERRKEAERINKKRIDKVYGKLRYSHISCEKNHFQYDLDYERYCREKDNLDSIINWLKTVVRPSVNNDAFNIIVSPLNASNSAFLKAVIENAFDNNSRIINIKFNSSFRDEIRTKYEHITNEYQSLYQNISGAKVNVYFVDNCIVEGTTFYRSRQFVYMLLSGFGMDMRCVSLYEGIILLSNRSSYETIQNLLPDKIDQHFYYYMRLNVPSFNTKNSICPACQLTNQYHLMWKRSTTPMIANEYRRLKEKHSPKTVIEYDKWLNETIDVSDIPDWFMSWLYYSVEFVPGVGFRYVDINGCVHDLFGPEGCLAALSEKNIKGVLRFGKSAFTELLSECDDQRKKAIFIDIKNVYRSIIKPGRDFARMICTHNIFKIYETVHSNAVSRENNPLEYERSLREGILSHIKEVFHSIESKAKENGVKPKGVLWLKFEWLISYIKILSRKQPAQYYQLRNAVYIILSELLDGMLKMDENNELSFILDLCNPSENIDSNSSFMPDLKFTFFLTVIRMLAALYSSYIINNLSRIFTFYDRCFDQYKASKQYKSFYGNSSADYIHYTKLVSFPVKEQFGFDIAKLIKWSSVYGVDDSKCHMVERVLKKYIILPNQDVSKWMSALKLAFLENTHVIYRGFKKLRNLWYEMLSKDKFDLIFSEFHEMLNKMKNSNGLRNEASSLLPLADFMGFQERINGGELIKLCYKLTSMLMLFYRLCELESKKKPITDPYDYVHLCNYMRNITACCMCKIIGVKEHHITTIASSDEFAEYLTDGDLSDEAIDTIVTKYKNLIHGDSQTMIDKAVTGFKSENGSKLLLIPVLIEDSRKAVNFDPDYYLIMYKGTSFKETMDIEPLSYDDLWNIRNVLFLRNRLEIVLTRDMSYLRDMVSSYGYIEPLNDDNKPRILHISDLHIKAEEKDLTERSRKIDDDVKKAIDEWDLQLDNNKPDLLLITGDVITGDYKASVLKKSYEKAEHTIKHIVRKIWSEKSEYGEDYIRSDWKKRILISTGNHDYASMNELEAHNLLRITTSGTPGALGDTMIKYSYFVNFIHSLLGAEIDEIVRYDVNQIVNYEKLKLSVVNLNTNSDVNPLRTNKVKVNAEEVSKMRSHTSMESNLVYMMHHTPMYDINYLSDVYYLHYSIENKVFEEILNAECKFEPGEDNHPNEVWLKLIHSLAHDFKMNIFGLTAEEQKQLLKRILSIIEKERKDEYIEKRLEDFLYYINCKDPISDDKCRHIKYYLREREYATEQDTNQYIEFAAKHFSSLGRSEYKFTILGGHTHESAVIDFTPDNNMSECLGIFEAGRFLERDENNNITLNYYLLSLENSVDSDSASVTISQSPKKPKVKNLHQCNTLKRIINYSENDSFQ